MIFGLKASCICDLKLNPELSSSVEIYHVNISGKGVLNVKRPSLHYSIPPKCSVTEDTYLKKIYLFSF